MTEERAARVRLATAAAIATSCATLGMVRLISTGPWTGSCLLVTAVIAAAGVATHRLTERKPAIIAVQLAAAVLVVTGLCVPGSAIGALIPGPGAIHAFTGQISAGLTEIRQYSPPTPATPGISTIMVLACAGFALLVDALAVTFRRVTLTGLPLLAVYLIPATRAPGGMTWLAFIMVASAYLMLVSVEGRSRLARWGRAVGVRQAAARGYQPTSPHAGPARRIAVAAVAAALVVPWFIPTLPGILPGLGAGAGGSGTTVNIDQEVNLLASLTSTTPIDLLRYTTDSPDARADYLQMSIDDEFNGNAWTQSTPARGPDPATPSMNDPGLTARAVQQADVTTVVTVTGNLAFATIPSPYAASSVSGLSIASYDPATDVLWAAGSPNTSRQGEQYTVHSIQAEPTAAQLMAAPPPVSPSLTRYRELPADFPAQVRSLAEQITAGDTTQWAEATALQNYFTQHFTYSLSVPAGDGNSAITRFLNNKKGFCEQFAGTMAAMARALGIPAVVAVGFTPGTEQPDGSYVVTTHDAHAWPMLYFTGFGWVRFEPTPTIASSGRGETPAYTESPNGSGPSASGSTGPAGNQAVPPSRQKSSCSIGPRGINRVSCGVAPSTSAQAPAYSWLGPIGAVPRWFHHWFLTGNAAQIAAKLILLAAAVVTTVPGAGRVARRRRRKALVKQAERYLAHAAADKESAPAPAPRSGSGRRHDRAVGAPLAKIALTAWDDLRECADDLGYPWSDCDTLRQSANRLSVSARLDQDAQAAIGRVTTLTEQARYGGPDQMDVLMLGSLPADLRTLRAALNEHADRSARIRAVILPTSSLARLRERRDRTVDQLTWTSTRFGPGRRARERDVATGREDEELPPRT